ncbi:hypothetical protein QYF36_013514 [Acer negundo]|nr:hypothetical protein QYF36_013514 [Acer negundo]
MVERSLSMREQYLNNRLNTLPSVKESGLNLLANMEHQGQRNMLILESIGISLAGRIMKKRASSLKLYFYDLHGDGAKIQVMADAR